MRPIVVMSILLVAGAPALANTRRVIYADADADGWGDPSVVRYSNGHVAVPGYTHRVGDCDDMDASVHPDAPEVCNDRDDDCDGLDDRQDTDVVGGSTWYADRDQDGFGDRRDRVRSCAAPYPYVDIAQDCNDQDYDVNPLAFEFCSDGDDDDCDGQVDECDVSLDDAALVVESSGAHTPTRGPLAVADMDGDGTGDLVVGGYPYDGESAVYVVYGPASGRVLTDDAVTIAASPEDASFSSFGWGVAGGDADGDGFDDLLVGAPNRIPTETYLFLGPVTADRDAADADAVLVNRSVADYTGLALLVMANHDGDGGADVVIGSSDDGDDGEFYEGAVYVAPGASLGTVPLLSDATYIYEGEGVDFVGYAVADLGDVSGDGLADLAIGAPWGNGGVLIVEGGSAPGRYFAADVASAVVTGEYQLGRRLQALDYDGDGAMDLITQDDPTDRPVVVALSGPFIGSVDATDAVASWEWSSADSAHGLGSAFAAEDFDGDGETDLVIGASGNYNDDSSGAVFFQWGIASGVIDVGTLPYVTGPFDGASLGIDVAALPDWNGDGIPEVAVGAFSNEDSADGAIYGFFSGSY